MARIDAQKWLTNWVCENINSPRHVKRKASMRDEAEACAQEAGAAGLSIADLKIASGGDLEDYLVNRQNELTDLQLKRG